MKVKGSIQAMGAAVAEMHGCVLPRMTHPRCIARGDSCCYYVIEWR